MIVTSRKFIFIALASAPPRPYSSSAARQPAAELSYSPTKVEMQSVDDKSKSGVRVDRRRLCAPAARHIASLVLAAFFALPHSAPAQDWSINARLLAAARTGDEAGLVRALADGAAVNARSRIGETALVIALKNDRPALASRMLDAGADVNLAAVNGVTPLMAASHAGQTDIVRRLLASGAEVSPVDRLQKTAMTYAAGQGRTDIVLLLLHAGVDVNAVLAHKLTALMWAAGYGRTDTVQALLAAGAKPGLKDDRGKTALDIAREGNFPDTVKLLETALKS
jgi:ankyrin repeat protein